MSDIFIDRDWFTVWKKPHYPVTSRGVGVVLSMYSPYFLDGSEADNNGNYTSAVTLGLFTNRRGEKCAILFSLFPRSILNPNQVVDHARNLCINYLNNSLIEMYDGWQPDLFIVPAEDDSKNALITEIRNNSKDVPVKRFMYKDYGGTLDNLVKRALVKMSEGRIYVAAHPANKKELRNIDERFLDTLSSYPSTIESRATMWSLCQAIIYLDSNGMFSSDGKDGDIKPKNKFYWV